MELSEKLNLRDESRRKQGSAPVVVADNKRHLGSHKPHMASTLRKWAFGIGVFTLTCVCSSFLRGLCQDMLDNEEDSKGIGIILVVCWKIGCIIPAAFLYVVEEFWAFAHAIWIHLAVFQLNVNFGLGRREGHFRMASVFVLLVEAVMVIAVAGVILFILPMKGAPKHQDAAFGFFNLINDNWLAVLLYDLEDKAEKQDTRLTAALRQAAAYVTPFDRSQQTLRRHSKDLQKLQSDIALLKKLTSNSRCSRVASSRRSVKQPVQLCSLPQPRHLRKMPTAAKDITLLQHLTHLLHQFCLSDSQHSSTQHAANVDANSSSVRQRNHRAAASARRHMQHNSTYRRTTSQHRPRNLTQLSEAVKTFCSVYGPQLNAVLEQLTEVQQLASHGVADADSIASVKCVLTDLKAALDNSRMTGASSQHSRTALFEEMPASEVATKVVAGTVADAASQAEQMSAADAASQAEQMSAADAATEAIAGAAASEEPLTPAQSPKRSVSRVAAGFAKLVNPSGRAAAVIRTSPSGQGYGQHEKQNDHIQSHHAEPGGPTFALRAITISEPPANWIYSGSSENCSEDNKPHHKETAFPPAASPTPHSSISNNKENTSDGSTKRKTRALLRKLSSSSNRQLNKLKASFKKRA